MGYSDLDLPCMNGVPGTRVRMSVPRPLKPRDIWAIRFYLDEHRRLRDRALFDLALDSKLRGCDLVKIKIGDITSGGGIRNRSTVIQKTGRPVQFEIMTEARRSLEAWLGRRRGTIHDFAFPSRIDYLGHLSTRQYARLVDEWVSTVGLMALPPLLTALAVAREKELGTIAQIYASPMTKGEFIAGKLLPYAIIAFIELLMVVDGGLLWFSVPIRGSLVLLIAVGLLYVVCTVSIGLLVSTLVRTQLAAMLVALLVSMMPAFLFSGFVYPIFTMPAAFQSYASGFPTRYFLEASRGIVLRGRALPKSGSISLSSPPRPPPCSRWRPGAFARGLRDVVGPACRIDDQGIHAGPA